MTVPTLWELASALEASWPPAEVIQIDDCRWRRSPGGGTRVNSVLPGPDPSIEAILTAAPETPWQVWRLSPEPSDLEKMLAAEGFRPFDETAVLLRSGAPATATSNETVSRATAPDAEVSRFWAGLGVGAERLAIMMRARTGRAVLTSRRNGRLVGAAFAAVGALSENRRVGFIHALAVAPEHRRSGVGAALIGEGARCFENEKAALSAACVVVGNRPAESAFRSASFVEAARYTYWRPPT